jgi:hypothetical protein
MIKPSILIWLFAIALITSCSEDEPPSKTDLLTAGPWKITYIEVKYKTSTANVTGQVLKFCNRDNRIIYAKDGAYIGEPGQNDCEGTETLLTGKWQWYNNETQIHVSVAGISNTFNVTELTSERLRYNIAGVPVDTDGDGNADDTLHLWFTLARD